MKDFKRIVVMLLSVLLLTATSISFSAPPERKGNTKDRTSTSLGVPAMFDGDGELIGLYVDSFSSTACN